MPQIDRIQSIEYIDCEPEIDDLAIWKRIDSFLLKPIDSELSWVDGEQRVNLNPHIMIPLPFWAADIEFHIEYQSAYGLLARQVKTPLTEELIRNSSFDLSEVLDFHYLEEQLRRISNPQFRFSVVSRKNVHLDELRENDLIVESVSGTELSRNYLVLSHVNSIEHTDQKFLLKNYRKKIGDLRYEIIRDIRMFAGSRPESWVIRIDKIEEPFTQNFYQSTIDQALHKQPQPILERLPAFFERSFNWDRNYPLDIVVTIPEIETGKEYLISTQLRNPAGEIYYPSGVPIIDKCILDIHNKLLECGIPVGPENESYQMVLRQLLVYRHQCSTSPGFIDESIVRKTEIEGFHRHLREKLPQQFNVEVVDMVSELELGNSRVDLLIESYPAELKLEDRKTVSTDEIVDRYQGQAADYVARQGAPFGFLLVLDTILEREVPTSRLDQDICFRQVQNASGSTVIVVAIIIRIPRSASELSKLRRATR